MPPEVMIVVALELYVTFPGPVMVAAFGKVIFPFVVIASAAAVEVANVPALEVAR